MLKWFSFSGIITEIKRVRWPKGKEMSKSVAIVLVFIVAFGIFFIFTEFVITFFVNFLGISGV
jgi:preprotein translocase subunit SecE